MPTRGKSREVHSKAPHICIAAIFVSTLLLACSGQAIVSPSSTENGLKWSSTAVPSAVLLANGSPITKIIPHVDSLDKAVVSNQTVAAINIGETRDASPEPNGTLTFSFEGWNASEIAELQAILVDALPFVQERMGPPFFNLNITIQKNDTYDGSYIPSSPPILKLRMVDPSSVLVHELVHAYYHNWSIGGSAEEGIARMIESDWNLGHFRWPLCYKDQRNEPDMTPAHGAIFSCGVEPSESYNMAADVWGSLYPQDPSFLSDLNSKLYENYSLGEPAPDTIGFGIDHLTFEAFFRK